MSCGLNSCLDRLPTSSTPDGLPSSLQDEVHGATTAVLYEELGGFESLLVLKLIGDDRLACAQGGSASTDSSLSTRAREFET